MQLDYEVTVDEKRLEKAEEVYSLYLSSNVSLSLLFTTIKLSLLLFAVVLLITEVLV